MASVIECLGEARPSLEAICEPELDDIRSTLITGIDSLVSRPLLRYE